MDRDREYYKKKIGSFGPYLRASKITGAKTVGKGRASKFKMNGVSYHAEARDDDAFIDGLVVDLTREDGQTAEVLATPTDLERGRMEIEAVIFYGLLLNPEMAPEFVGETVK